MRHVLLRLGAIVSIGLITRVAGLTGAVVCGIECRAIDNARAIVSGVYTIAFKRIRFLLMQVPFARWEQNHTNKFAFVIQLNVFELERTVLVDWSHVCTVRTYQFVLHIE